ncbi:MAG TPA: transcription antitermination factor NusB [Verrucomicrobia bacterium]|nr:transcription antitermination factor NusB [Verrucomicrobiota bacterium]
MTVTRRQAREWAIQMLTAMDLNPPDEGEDFLTPYWEEISALEEEPVKVPARYRRFTEERVLGVKEHLPEIDAKIGSHLANWTLDRLGTVERAVLRLGVWELLYTDVPPAVVINEAVDLVNWFSTPVSRAFVNGVLDRIAHEKNEKGDRQ